MTTSRRHLAKPEEVVEHIGVSIGHLAQMRFRGTVPRFVKPTGGRAVRYDWADVEAYVEAQKFTQTGRAALAATS